MTLSLLLPWFPIILAVGVGGRLLGRRRGFAMGLLCGLFWVVLVQSSAGAGVWRNFGVVATVLIGASAIFLMGGWAGENGGGETLSSSSVAAGAERAVHDDRNGLDAAAESMIRFDDWLEEHRHDPDPWPAFGESVRATLLHCSRATHVRLYRLLAEREELVPLREPNPMVETRTLSARDGIIGHVVTTGRAFVRGDSTQGDLVRELAASGDESVAWCFAICQGTQRLGAIVVGHLDLDAPAEPSRLRVTEQLVNLCWSAVSEAVRSREAGRDDPGSGVFNRTAFLESAGRSLRESYAQSEPVGIAMIALEGLRDLNDSGRWEVADELIQDVALTLRGKIRADDCLGRFDGSRFIWLLRRVDSALAGLIVRQVMNRLTAKFAETNRWGAPIRVRCGLAGSGTGKPELRELICNALEQSKRARIEDLLVASELDAAVRTHEAVT